MGKGFTVILVLLVIAIIVFTFFGNKISFTKSLHEKWIGDKLKFGSDSKKQETNSISTVDIENDWCKVQQMAVDSTDREAPIYDGIIGWDNLESCCVREVIGFSCGTNSTNTKIHYCFTSNIGGTIKYVTIDGYFGNVTKYRSYVDDIDKERILNKPCDLTKYPKVFQ